MKILGKELTFNGNKVYHAGNKPTASEIGAAASNHTHNYAGSSSAGGNANAAVKLATARTINGTSFDGSANITTANWGTARNIQIGNTSKSVNGSANVSWSLSEIGAAAASHGRHIPDVCETITDWNNATKNGWYMGNNATNSPTANAWYFGEVIAHNANYVVQTVYQFTASTDAKAMPKYIRAKMNGTWGAWTNVTVSKAVPSNAVFTDTNTWRGVQDNLTSTATDQSLSANQGKVLKSLIDGKAASSHTHNYAATSHNHGLLHDSFGVTIADTTTDNGWSMINGSYNGFLLKSIRSSASAPAWLQGNYSAGIAFGGADTKGVMSVAYSSPSVRFAGGNGSKPVWHFTVNGSSGKTYNMDSLAANTANTLATARTINGTSFNGSANITTANWGAARSITIGNTTKTVDGSGDVTWTLAEIGATGGVSGNYLPLTGGTLTGDLTIKKSDGAVSKINVHRTLSSKDMRGSMDVYSYGGGSVALSTYNMTDNKQTSSYIFGGDSFWSPKNADGTVPDIGSQSNPFNKGWFDRMQVNTAFYTEGTTTLRGTIHLFNPIMYNASSLKAYNTAGSELHICGVDANNNIFLGLNNQTYINVNNTMRAYRDIHVLNGAAMRITGQFNVARTTTYPQMAIFQTGGDGNGSGDGNTHIGFFQESLGGYTHYFRGGGPVIVDNGGSLQVAKPWIKIGGKSLTISTTAPSAAVGDVWIQI